MAERIEVANMSNELFQAYYDELCNAHSILYADFMLGVPQTLTVRWHSEKEMRRSLRKETCVDCQNPITTDLEVCLFDTIDESDNRHSFYLCCQCQKCQPSSMSQNKKAR